MSVVIGLYVLLIISIAYLFLWYGRYMWQTGQPISALFFWLVSGCVLVFGLLALWIF